MRMNAGQVKFRPRVYLWYAEDNSVETVYLPIEEGVISREHVEVQKAQDTRMEAFAESLDKDIEVGLSFGENLKTHFKTNRVNRDIRELIWEAVGE